ncbi:MAG: GNAT family N-acetyltransferase [Oscillospiraceae bacterium]
MEKLELYVPKLEELWFYQQMMSDPDTMSYNANWDVSYPGYHRETGCIDFPKPEWAEWYDSWTGHEPKRFYAYIKRCSDGAWIGDVCFHYTPEKDWWDMGIVMYAPYRGMGYAVPALRLMLDHAFRDCGVMRIHNDFEIARNEIAAWKTHISAGFKETGTENGFKQMMITGEDYFALYG